MPQRTRRSNGTPALRTSQQQSQAGDTCLTYSPPDPLSYLSLPSLSATDLISLPVRELRECFQSAPEDAKAKFGEINRSDKSKLLQVIFEIRDDLKESERQDNPTAEEWHARLLSLSHREITAMSRSNLPELSSMMKTALKGDHCLEPAEV